MNTHQTHITWLKEKKVINLANELTKHYNSHSNAAHHLLGIGLLVLLGCVNREITPGIICCGDFPGFVICQIGKQPYKDVRKAEMPKMGATITQNSPLIIWGHGSH